MGKKKIRAVCVTIKVVDGENNCTVQGYLPDDLSIYLQQALFDWKDKWPMTYKEVQDFEASLKEQEESSKPTQTEEE